MTVNINASTNSKRIPIGRCEDNEATRVVFDCSGFSSAYGSGQATLLHRRSKEKISYIVQNVTQEDNTVIWTVSSDDTAFSGKGTLQLMWAVNDVVVHSHFYTTITDPSLTDSSTEPTEVKSALQLLIDSCYTKEETDDLIAHMRAGSDWDANEGESGYIENRPFYSETVEGEEVVHQLDSKYISGKFITSGTGENSEIFNDITNNIASFPYAHAEGMANFAANVASHVEGRGNSANGPYSHCECGYNESSGAYSHCEGFDGKSSAQASHCEGMRGKASGMASHCENADNEASGYASHAEGSGTKAKKSGSHSEGNATVSDGDFCHVEGIGSSNSIKYTGTNNYRYPGAYASAAHIEGIMGRGEGQGCHSEGYECLALADYSHSEGIQTSALNRGCHSEGQLTTANAEACHAEGYLCNSNGPHSHTEGNSCSTTIYAEAGHAEGIHTESRGQGSHSEGLYTVATADASHVVGKYNVIDDNEDYVEIVGNGTEANYRSNARTLDWNGNESLAGSLTLGMGSADEVTITPAQLAKLLGSMKENHWESPRFFLPSGYVTYDSSSILTEQDAIDSSSTYIYAVYYLPGELDLDAVSSLEISAYSLFRQNSNIDPGFFHKAVTTFDENVSVLWASNCKGIKINYICIIRASDFRSSSGESYAFPSDVKTIAVLTSACKPDSATGRIPTYIQSMSLDWTPSE